MLKTLLRIPKPRMISDIFLHLQPVHCASEAYPHSVEVSCAMCSAGLRGTGVNMEMLLLFIAPYISLRSKTKTYRPKVNFFYRQWSGSSVYILITLQIVLQFCLDVRETVYSAPLAQHTSLLRFLRSIELCHRERHSKHGEKQPTDAYSCNRSESSHWPLVFDITNGWRPREQIV